MVGVQRGQQVGQPQVGQPQVGQPQFRPSSGASRVGAVPVGGRRDRRREVGPAGRVRPHRQVPPGPGGLPARLAKAVALVAVWATTTGGLAVLVGQAADGVRGAGPARLEDAVALVAGGAALAAAWWLAVAVLASVGAALLASRRPDGTLTRAAAAVARRTAPPALRRAVVLAVGLSLAGTAPALATPRAPGQAIAPPVACAPAHEACLDPSWAAPETTTEATTDGPASAAAPGAAPATLDPGWVPVAPGPSLQAGPAISMPGPEPRPRHVARSEVVVRSGDTLWSIVERHLGPHATAAEVAAEWPRWHATNRGILGSDPDRLLPGQRLRPPGAAARGRVRPPDGPRLPTGASVTGTADLR